MFFLFLPYFVTLIQDYSISFYFTATFIALLFICPSIINICKTKFSQIALWKKWFGPKEEDEKGKDKKSEDSDDEESDGTEGDGTTPKKVEKAQADPDGYQVFKMPWSLSLSYSFNIREDRSKPINRYSMRYPYTYTHNINANGNIKISNNWSLSFNSGYDFQAKEITQTSCTISRDLHCFNLSASLSPFGRWKYYNVTIRANASILQDLKYEQRSQTQSNIQWY